MIDENYIDQYLWSQWGMKPFGFTRYERDVISGLYYAQARRYDAENGRFTSRDMIKGNISQMQSQNEYAYCLGNPLMYVDRDGEVPTIVIGALIGGVVALTFDVVVPLIQKEEIDVSDTVIDTVTGAAVGAIAGTGVGIGWILLASGSIASLNYTVKKIANGEFVDEYDSAEMIITSISASLFSLISTAYGTSTGKAITWEILTQIMSLMTVQNNNISEQDQKNISKD